MIRQSERVARAIRHVRLRWPGQKTFIGLCSKNRPECVIVEQAIYAFSSVLVPIYDVLGPKAIL